MPLEFTLASLEPLAVGAKAPHPNSARLFVVFFCQGKPKVLCASVGSLEKGKDADLVILSGPPFAGGSRVEAVVVNGIVAWRH